MIKFRALITVLVSFAYALVLIAPTPVFASNIQSAKIPKITINNLINHTSFYRSQSPVNVVRYVDTVTRDVTSRGNFLNTVHELLKNGYISRKVANTFSQDNVIDWGKKYKLKDAKIDSLRIIAANYMSHQSNTYVVETDEIDQYVYKKLPSLQVNQNIKWILTRVNPKTPWSIVNYKTISFHSARATFNSSKPIKASSKNRIIQSMKNARLPFNYGINIPLNGTTMTANQYGQFLTSKLKGDAYINTYVGVYVGRNGKVYYITRVIPDNQSNAKQPPLFLLNTQPYNSIVAIQNAMFHSGYAHSILKLHYVLFR